MPLEHRTELLKGLLEGCVLELIRRNTSYGYAITRQLNALGFTEVVDGTVYTILVRLEKQQLISAKKQASQSGPPRKLYSLTDSGQEALQQFWEKWEAISRSILQLKEGVTHDETL